MFDGQSGNQPAVLFHEQCDAFAETVTVARNSLGATFGGYAEVSWAGSRYDQTATGDFIFGLEPGTPSRFDPIGGRYGNDLQYNQPNNWPGWGAGHDLIIGAANSRLNTGYCTQGTTFAGSPNQVCCPSGEYCDWGETQMMVWRRSDAPAIPEPICCSTWCPANGFQNGDVNGDGSCQSRGYSCLNAAGNDCINVGQCVNDVGC